MLISMVGNRSDAAPRAHARRHGWPVLPADPGPLHPVSALARC
jgi:hypothetical protein